jgi:hypothetical protein
MACEKFNEARKLTDNIMSKNPSKMLKALGREQRLNIWTGLAFSELEISSSSSEKGKHLENARSYARRVQCILEPQGRECDALDFLIKRKKTY